MPKLIGLTGLAKSGKDTIAALLFHYHDFTPMAFAGPLKEAAEAAFGLPSFYFHDQDLKEQVLSYWGMTPREILQKMGTEAMQPVFGKDFWVRRWIAGYAALKDTDNVVVSDVRFQAEADAVRGLGGTIIHVKRQGAGLCGDLAEHSSEAGVMYADGDVVLENNGTIEDLKKVLYPVLRAVREIK